MINGGTAENARAAEGDLNMHHFAHLFPFLTIPLSEGNYSFCKSVNIKGPNVFEGGCA